MNATASQRCAHPACRCTVPVGDTYCSDHCRQVVDEPAQGGCGCGHSPCQPSSGGKPAPDEPVAHG